MSIDSPLVELSTPLRPNTLPPRQAVSEVVSNVRKATWSRVGFAAFVALVSMTVLPVWIAAAWLAFMTLWETMLRIGLEDRLVLPIARRDEEALKGVASITQGEYFYASNANDLKKVYQSLNSRIVLEAQETEISGLVSAAAALLALLAGLLSMLWFNRIM